MFRMKGKSLVKSIIGHDWGDCGRPRAEIEWQHGDTTKTIIKNATELKGDANGFIEAWGCYCDRIGAEDGFRKGYVDKTCRIVVAKKQKANKTKW